jgi:hypothetical protein
MKAPPPRQERQTPLTPAEIERAVDEIVREFADRLDVGPEKARRVLRVIVSHLSQAGISFEEAIALLQESEAAEKRAN